MLSRSRHENEDRLGTGDKGVKIAIETPLSGFQNDIADVVRLFYGEGAAVEPQEKADARLVHEHVLEDGMWREKFTLTGENFSMDEALEAPAVFGGLEEKRQLKRLIKRCCYQLIRTQTGRRPAWGSLTGIRPTRVYYQQMEAGKTRDEAREAIRDLFDLADEKIDLLDEILDAQEGLIDRDPRNCDLYIGIPFCTTRCSYC